MAQADYYNGMPDAGVDESRRAALLASMKGAMQSPGGLPGGTAQGAAPPLTSDTPAPMTEPPTAPTSTLEKGKYRNALTAGFNGTKIDNPEYASHPKYGFANIAQDYADTPEGLAAMAQDPRFAQAGFKFLGKDKIQTPNGSVIDVGTGFSEGGGKGWNWQPVSGPDFQETQGQGMQGGGMATDPASVMGSLNQGVPTDTSFFQKLLEQARGLSGPASTDRNALLSLLGGQ